MNGNVKEKLQALFAAYAKSLPNKIDCIIQQWTSLKEHWDKAEFEDLHRNVHNLCGSAGTYGYVAIGKSARDLEVYIKQLLGEEALSPVHLQKIGLLMGKLKDSLKLAQPDKAFIQERDVNQQCIVPIFDQDDALFKELKANSTEPSYKLYFVDRLEGLLEIFKEEKPAVLIIDLEKLDDKQLNQFSEIYQPHKKDTPLVCIAKEGNILTRLKAIRLGSVAFFQKPIDSIFILKKLNQLLGLEENEPYRILVVDDSPPLADYFALILKEAGLITQAITNPLLLLEAIEDFQPDLILMDIYMPNCTGLELASILRQEPQYTRIPIIFLSMEDDRFKQLSALNLGGDDFLVKPIVPQQLIKSVISRAKRASILSSFMMRDSLTGLLNHTNILQRLEHEMLRAERQDQALSFVMLDMDHFKKINDNHGHLAGDKVLRMLSSYLCSFFRKTDIVGRYGGEEFAVVMPNTNAEEALEICEKFRIKFSECRFEFNHSPFSVTLSGGIASCPEISNLNSLVNAADRALYAAKQQGRNQIKLSTCKN